MDTMKAFLRATEAHGKVSRVFDWAKAARLIKEHQPAEAGAGLAEDWEYTGGTIYRDGNIVDDDYTFLSSNHACPELSLDGEHHDCFVMADETEWNANTTWPDEARAILKGDDTDGN